MWFDSWSDLTRVALVGVAAYTLVICVLRVSGKRTLSQLNAFDFIVTVALGSTLATILLSKDVSWTEGALALALLAGLQFVLALVASRIPAFRRFVTAEPSVVLAHGQLRHEVLRANRLAVSEVYQAIRSSGVGDACDVGSRDVGDVGDGRKRRRSRPRGERDVERDHGATARERFRNRRRALTARSCLRSKSGLASDASDHAIRARPGGTGSRAAASSARAIRRSGRTGRRPRCVRQQSRRRHQPVPRSCPRGLRHRHCAGQRMPGLSGWSRYRC